MDRVGIERDLLNGDLRVDHWWQTFCVLISQIGHVQDAMQVFVESHSGGQSSQPDWWMRL